jgi:hypothetical protein
VLISDLLKMDIPARTLIQITGIDATKRTINKARRGLGDARDRVGWEGEITLDAKQLNALEAALQEEQQIHKVRDANRVFERGVVVFSDALIEEQHQLHSFRLAYAEFARMMSSHAELKKKLDYLNEVGANTLEGEAAMKSFGIQLATQRATVMECFITYKECVNKTKDHKVVILKARKVLNRKIPAKLMQVDKKAIGARKEAYKTMDSFNQEEVECSAA